MSRLAFFTNNLALGGAQRVIVNLTTELAERGRDVEIVLINKRGELLDEVHDDVAVIDIDTEPFIDAVLDLRRYLKKRRPDVLVSTVNVANLMAIFAVKTTRTGTRHIVRMANTPSKKAQEYDELLTDRPIPYLMRFLYPRADQIVAVSEGLAGDLIENYEVDPDRITVIYNPTVTDELIEQSKVPVDHPWLENPKTDVVLGVGSLSEQKDYESLVRAFSLVQKKRDAKLVILGEGSKREQLESLVQELGIEADVSLPGTVANPYPYMAHADVFVLSSRYEGCPNVLIEAMACGCPVVATDCPHGPREILEHGSYGLLVSVGDHESLANGITQSLQSPNSSTRLQDRAQDFHVEAIAGKYERFFVQE